MNVNGALFGVARREDFARLGFPDEVGGDWLLVAALAARGRVRTLRDVHIHRSIDGLSSDQRALARSFELRGLLGAPPSRRGRGRLAREIAHSPAYAQLGGPGASRPRPSRPCSSCCVSRSTRR